MTVASVLQAIGPLSRPLALRDLKGLSGLSGAERTEFFETWRRIEDERRAKIASEMVELAEDNVELDFTQVWSWMLDDADARVRASAIEGQWEDVSPRALRQIMALLRSDPSEEVRAAAAAALSRFAYLVTLDELDDVDGELQRTLARIASDEREPLEVRRRALESAGYFADNEAIQSEIERAYSADDQLLRESAVAAMGRSMLPRWMPVISRELTSDSPALRYEAARAAGEMGEDARPLLAKLAPLLTDDDTEIALASIWAFGQIGGEAAKRALQQVRKSQDEARSQAALEALEELSLGEGIV